MAQAAHHECFDTSVASVSKEIAKSAIRVTNFIRPHASFLLQSQLDPTENKPEMPGRCVEPRMLTVSRQARLTFVVKFA